MSKIEEALNKARRLNPPKLKSKPDGDYEDAQAAKKKSLDSFGNTLSASNSIPSIDDMENGTLLDSDALLDLKIIFSDMDNSDVANTYRNLRTKLLQRSLGKNFTTLITSCVDDSQTDNVALNISAAFSFDASKTSLLIDCNLNKPKLDKILQLEDSGKYGLVDYLEKDGIGIDEIIRHTGIKRMRLIPVGRDKEVATEYFTSTKMCDLMTNLLTRYSDRYIFVDSAPITQSADTRILVDLCDQVILVVPYGKATKGTVRQAVDAIGKDKLLGVVFDEVPTVPFVKWFS